MISSYKRKQSQYLQQIESAALNIVDRFAISSMNSCSSISSTQIRKGMLFITFCCLFAFYLLNNSIKSDEFTGEHVNSTLNIGLISIHKKITMEEKKTNNVKNNLTTVSDRKTDRYNHHIAKASEQYQVDPYLIKAIIMTESSYNPKAVSYRGAKGLMQLMPVTAREVGVKDCFNPEDNINGGVKYFSKLLTRFQGNVDLALAAYNAGSTKVRKYQGVPPFRATRKYIKKVNRYYEIFKNEDKTAIKII